MAPSPRKRATRSSTSTSFAQTWGSTDAAFLDPSALPIGRIPRGWERKAETKKTEEGREKKIWRRVGLRSRVEDAEEEQQDARARAVKKQQHMSPKAMEKSGTRGGGRRRAFKATRWDRRKSVLPRKKATRSGESDGDAQEAADASDSDDAPSDENVSIVEPVVDADMEDAQDILPEGASRRGTFTFTVQEEVNTDELVDYTTVEEHDETTRSETSEHATTEEIQYPELPSGESESVVLMTTVDVHQCLEAVSDPGMHDTTRQEATLVEEEVAAEQDAPLRDGALEDTEIEQDDEATTSESPRPEESDVATPETIEEVAYPALPVDAVDDDLHNASASPQQQSLAEDTDFNNEIMEAVEETYEAVEEQGAAAEDDGFLDAEEQSSDEEFTEASLQLDILHDYQDTLRGRQLLHTDDAEGDDADIAMDEVEESHQHEPMSTPAVSAPLADITDGLTLSFTPLQATPAASTSPKSQSPAPPIHSAADDATMTIALDDDTALLKSFLSRAAASKAEKAAIMTHRRESLQNRRDSDVVRHALASPRKALEEKDPNSPSKQNNELTLDLSENLALKLTPNGLTPGEGSQDDATEKVMRGSRRSSRAKKSRLPAPALSAPATAQTSKISIRRPDGTDHVVLKKSDAQELALLTKANTRKNKQGAFGVTIRLLKLAADAPNLLPLDDSTKELIIGKNIRWDEQLAYYQENPETIAEAESLATPDELGMPDPPSTKKPKVSKSSTPKIRRVRGLGTANGTPGKALLAPSSLLPEDVQEDKEAAQPPQQLPKPKVTRAKKMPVASGSGIPAPTSVDTKLPSLDIAPVGVTPTKERKSRLAAPKKVVFPTLTASIPADGKENAQRTGIVGATPKKGIPAPKVNVPPTLGMESGLPRRRGRRI